MQALRRAWQQALETAQARLEALAATARWAQLDDLQRRAAWCDQAARTLVAAPESPPDGTALRKDWEALGPAGDSPAATALSAAAERILAAADGDAEAQAQLGAQMDAAADKRRALCLQLEIAAGVDSPPELEPERMQLQVQRLAARMGEGNGAADRSDDPLALLQAWYAAAPAAPAPDLDARLARITAALRPADGAAA
jgi:hypothetical protein